MRKHVCGPKNAKKTCMGYQESVWGLRNENVWGNEHAKKELEKMPKHTRMCIKTKKNKRYIHATTLIVSLLES